jgi:hypothetical protein
MAGQGSQALALLFIELAARSREQTGLTERNLTRISIGLKAIFAQTPSV